VALEDGVSRVTAAQSTPPVVGRYTAVHVQENGKWLIASVRETAGRPASNTARLQAELGWLIGSWETKQDKRALQTTASWIGDKSFIRRDYTVREDDKQVTSGVQIIGWDPRAGCIRSWSFDGRGGFGTGLWAATADGWAIDTVGALPDGTPTASHEYIIRVPGDDRLFGWRSVDRVVGDTRIPDTGEIVLDRVPAKP